MSHIRSRKPRRMIQLLLPTDIRARILSGMDVSHMVLRIGSRIPPGTPIHTRSDRCRSRMASDMDVSHMRPGTVHHIQPDMRPSHTSSDRLYHMLPHSPLHRRSDMSGHMSPGTSTHMRPGTGRRILVGTPPIHIVAGRLTHM